MSQIKRTIRQGKEIYQSIISINKTLPALKESEIVGYSYHLMRQDFDNNIIDITIWDKLLKYNFNDSSKKTAMPADTRGITIDSDDFDVVVNGKRNGKDDPKNTWAYLKQDGVSRASMQFITKLVLYYVRGKLQNEKKEATNVAGTINIDGVDLMLKVSERTAELLRKGDVKTINKYLKGE